MDILIASIFSVYMLNEKKMDQDILDRLWRNDPSLTELTIEFKSENDIESLLQTLSFGNSALTKLTLYNNEIGKYMIQALVDILLDKRSALTHLSINNQYDSIYKIGEAEMQILATGLLSGSSKLTHLNLETNDFGDDGAQALAKVLSSGQSLITKMNIGNNYITNDGIQALVTAISEGNSQLTVLNMEYNLIMGQDGALKLTPIFFSKKSTLTVLKIGGNRIGNSGAKIFADALSLGKSRLTVLDLSENEIGNEGAKVLATAISFDNFRLTELLLWGNDIYDDGKKFLEDALRHNTTLIDIGIGYDEDFFSNALLAYTKRNKRAQKKAKKAVIAILILSKRKFEKQKRKEEDEDEDEEDEDEEDLLEPLKTKNNYDTVFEKLLRETGSQQGASYLIDMAKELWKTRYDTSWWTNAERREVRLEQRSDKRLKTMQTCIASHICDNKAILMEASDPTQVFCSSYCQFMHYTGAPDLRGMNVEQIKQALN